MNPLQREIVKDVKISQNLPAEQQLTFARYSASIKTLLPMCLALLHWKSTEYCL